MHDADVFRAPGACATPPMAGQTAIAVATAARRRFPRRRSTTRRATGRSVTTSRTTASRTAATPQATVDTAGAERDRRPSHPFAGAPNFVAARWRSRARRTTPAPVSSRPHCSSAPSAPARRAPPSAPGTRLPRPTAPMTSATSSSTTRCTSFTATSTVVVDNTDPLGSVLTPAAGAVVSGGTADRCTRPTRPTRPPASRTVQWQRSWTGAGGWGNANGGAIANPANGYRASTNTTTAAPAGDGPDLPAAVITDRAGNAFDDAGDRDHRRQHGSGRRGRRSRRRPRSRAARR